MLATILKPTEGTAFVGGYDILSESEKVRRIIGIVFQDTTVDRNLTGFENLWVYGKLYGLSGSYLKDRIVELLRFVELERWKDVPLRKYSGGMIRRLEIARSMLNEPEILFLDEPTLGLDPQTRVHIWEYIRRIREEKDITILLTTHYLEEADVLCDGLAIIDYGKIIAIGSPNELKSKVSGDTIYLKIAHEDGRKIDFFMRSIAENLNAKPQLLRDSRVMIVVPNAPQIIPQIFRIASETEITIKELTYSRPSLNEVFIKLTGRSIRDESGSIMQLMRLRRAIRFGRR